MNTQAITGAFVLPPDVLIIPATQIDAEMRSSCECTDEDFIVTRPLSRTQSRVLNNTAAGLLQLFREPRLIVDAALRTALAHDLDPEVSLEQTFVTLRPFLKARWLVPAGSEEATSIAQSLHVGDTVGRWRIIECVQLLEDCEVYQVGDVAGKLAALKIARPASPGEIKHALDWECEALRSLDVEGVPRLLEQDVHGGQHYFVMSWRAGVRIDRAAEDLRALPESASRAAMLELCLKVLDRYAQLNARGIIHGDVFPKNILVSATGEVSVIDFGLCAINGVTRKEHARRGVPEYYDPEYARAVLDRTPRPIMNARSEQYALGALIFRIMTGTTCFPLSPTRDGLLEAIAVRAPRTFPECGVSPWPTLERVLGRALRKNPDERFAGLQEFCDALRGVLAEREASPADYSYEVSSQMVELLNELGGARSALTLSREVPSASVTYGAAGIAYGLYACAQMGEDSALLAAADTWSTEATRRLEDGDAFTHEGLGITDAQLGPASLYYGKPGVHLVQALLAQSRGDGFSLGKALQSYESSCSVAGVEEDLTLGRSGALLGTSLLIDALGSGDLQSDCGYAFENLFSLARGVRDELWRDRASVSGYPERYLGIAHGAMGTCFATMIFSEVSGDPWPSGLDSMLEELASLGIEHGRGMRWPIRLAKAGRSNSYMESWCHGSPGYVIAWLAAHRHRGDARYLELAQRAAWAALDAEDSASSLCCGSAGRAYAFLALYRQTGDASWIDRARRAAEHAVANSLNDPRMRHSLYKGPLGAAVLAMDLQSPETASFPLFEREIRN